jgi:hypothetical protein
MLDRIIESNILESMELLITIGGLTIIGEVLNPQHNSSTFLNKQNEAITPSIIQQNKYEKDAFEVDLFPIPTQLTISISNFRFK